MENIKIIIVEDFLMVRTGLSLIINANDKFEVIAVANDGEEFLQLLTTYSPDLVLMDVNMPKMNGIVATIEALKIKPNLKIIALSMYEDEEYIENMMQAGAKGFIFKKVGIDEIYKAMDIVLSGEVYLAQEVMFILTRKFYTSKPNKINQINLNWREKEILRLLCQGYSTSEIARKFGLSSRTVECHRSQLLKKTNTKNTINLVIHAMRHNYFPIPVEI
jgi:DNA-binding NarL/FixJ family response regulator